MTSKAARLQIIMELLKPALHDPEGNFIGFGEPFITEAQAIELMNMPCFGCSPNCRKCLRPEVSKLLTL